MTFTAGNPSEEDRTETFEPPVMHRRVYGPASRGSIFTPSVTVDAAQPDADNSRGDTASEPAPLFVTEAEAMDAWELTAEGLRTLFGPPIPAGVVWHEPVWPIAQMELIYDEYVRPVFRRLHLDPETDVKGFFYWTKGEPAPPTKDEIARKEEHRQWLETPAGRKWQAQEDERQARWRARLETMTVEEALAAGD